MFQEEYDSRTLSGRHPSEIQGICMKISDKFNLQHTLAQLQLDVAELRGMKDASDLAKYDYNFELELRVLKTIDMHSIMESSS